MVTSPLEPPAITGAVACHARERGPPSEALSRPEIAAFRGNDKRAGRDSSRTHQRGMPTLSCSALVSARVVSQFKIFAASTPHSRLPPASYMLGGKRRIK